MERHERSKERTGSKPVLPEYDGETHMGSTLSKQQELEFLKILENRFNLYPKRHEGMIWEDVRVHLQRQREKLFSIWNMEETGGEPDVVLFDAQRKAVIFVDCSPESPAGRRNLCYDERARMQRKAHRPQSSTTEMADRMGIELLDEHEYLVLQSMGAFDEKTSSWLKTPAGMRDLGGALFGDRRFNRPFIYHNGASSYYGVRGFRGKCEL